MARVTNGEVKREIGNHRGWLSFTARKLKITRDEIRRRAAKSKEVALAIREAEELRDDIAEMKLFESVETGAAWAITFYLRMRAARRAAEPAQHNRKFNVNLEEEYFGNIGYNHPAPSAEAPNPDSGEPGPV